MDSVSLSLSLSLSVALILGLYRPSSGPIALVCLFVRSILSWLLHQTDDEDTIVDEDTILEVKCPYAHKDKAICPTTVPYLKSNGGTLMLNASHNYYYQVQGQMLCTKRKRCLFVIYSFKDLVVIEIPRDELFIKSMLDKLRIFYKSHFEPAIINKFV